MLLLGIPCESDLLEGTPIFFVVVETDVVTKVTVFAALCTSDVELFAVGLLEELSLTVVVGPPIISRVALARETMVGDLSP